MNNKDVKVGDAVKRHRWRYDKDTCTTSEEWIDAEVTHVADFHSITVEYRDGTVEALPWDGKWRLK